MLPKPGIEPVTSSRSAPGRDRPSGNLVRLAAIAVLAGSAVVAVVLGSRFGEDRKLVASPLIGQPAPDMTLPYLAGEGELALRFLRGHVLAVNFWASWCLACRAEHDDLIAAARAYEDLGVSFVGVVYQDAPESAVAFLDELGWGGDNYHYLLDPGSRAAIAFGVFGVPETFFIDQNGVVVGKIIGESDALLLGTTIDQILRGERPGQHTAGTVQKGPGG